MPAPPFAAVLFDLDDTLYLERNYVRSGYAAIARRLREQHGTEDRYEDWLWERFTSGRSAGAFDALSEAFGLGLTPEQILDLVGVYRWHRPDITPLPGVVSLLDSLHGRCRLGLLSDGFLPAQQLKLDALALADRFQAVLFTESLGREMWKPNPRGFELLSERLDAPPQSCVYIADNPAKDFLAPNGLGWHTLRLRIAGQLHYDRQADSPHARAKQTATSLKALAEALGV